MTQSELINLNISNLLIMENTPWWAYAFWVFVGLYILGKWAKNKNERDEEKRKTQILNNEKWKILNEDNGKINLDVKKQIVELYAKGKKLEATKYCKDNSELSLKDARDYVEYLWFNQDVLKSKEKINSSLSKVDKIQKQLEEVQKIKIIEVNDFKSIIIENEKLILKKGGDNQLFSFMKLDSFLKDFRKQIVDDQNGLKDVLDIEWLKSVIINEGNRKDMGKLLEDIQDLSAKLDGKEQKGFNSKLEKLFNLGDIMNVSMESQVRTLEYYRNIATSMIVFYLNDKKIRYFEIYEAFEKLGVFDSTWQKNVLNNLESIDNRLAQINNQLTELNNNFISLIESSENVVAELKDINSGIMTNNMLQAITAYQTWKINKNTKSLN